MQSHTSSRALAEIALFAAVIAVLGLVPKFDLPLGVPITAQSLGVMLAGCLLNPRRAFLAVALFLAGVALGLPLLSGGRGGIGVFASPGVGYLLAFPMGAAATSAMIRALPGPIWARAFGAAVFGGIGVVYLGGVAGLSYVADLDPRHAMLANLIFIPGDLIKCGICAGIVQAVARGLPEWQLERD